MNCRILSHKESFAVEESKVQRPDDITSFPLVSQAVAEFRILEGEVVRAIENVPDAYVHLATDAMSRTIVTAFLACYRHLLTLVSAVVWRAHNHACSQARRTTSSGQNTSDGKRLSCC